MLVYQLVYGVAKHQSVRQTGAGTRSHSPSHRAISCVAHMTPIGKTAWAVHTWSTVVCSLWVAVVLSLSQAQSVFAADTVSEQDIIQQLRPRGITRNLVIQDAPPAPVAPVGAAAPSASVSVDPPHAHQGGSSLITPAAPAPGAPEKPAVDRDSVSLVIQFQVNSHLVLPEGVRQLDILANALQSAELKGLTFQVEGHSDASGPAASNLRLSQRRAEEVVHHLVRSGVEARRLQALGFGFSKLLPGVHPHSAQHRRVVVRRLP